MEQGDGVVEAGWGSNHNGTCVFCGEVYLLPENKETFLSRAKFTFHS